MKTVCLYFQVHQPWRLKKYRFFNMGKDHNYLDDLMNRSIMHTVEEHAEVKAFPRSTVRSCRRSPASATCR